MRVLFGLALLTLLLVAAWQDLAHRRIPNAIPLALAGLWPIAVLLAVGVAAPLTAFGIALGVFLAGFVCWQAGWLGGGDVKLIAALSLWAGPDLVAPMLLLTGLLGGGLALIQLARRAFLQPAPLLAALSGGSLLLHVALLWPWVRNHSRPAAATSSLPAETLPYGVAIALAGGWVVCRWAFV